MSSEIRELATEICIVSYGSHIGEYIKQKVQSSGRALSWVAEKLNTSRQNFTSTFLEKAELSLDRIHQIRSVLGDDFFDEFYEANPDLKKDYPERDRSAPDVAEALPRLHSESGYSLSIQIDPENFNPERFARFSSRLQNMLEDYKKELEEGDI